MMTINQRHKNLVTLLLILFLLGTCVYFLLFHLAINGFHHHHHQKSANAVKMMTNNNTKRAEIIDNNSYDVKELDVIFEKRRQQLIGACQRRYHKPQTPLRELQWAVHVLSVNPSIQNSFFVDEDNRALFCLIPKVASTNWKRLLLFVAGGRNLTQDYDMNFSSPDDIPHNFVHWSNKWPKMSFRPISAYRNRTSKMMEIITNYTRVIWVRHPLIRLVSAWKSKLTGKNDFYSNGIGRDIIKQFRHPSLAAAAQNDSSVDLFEFFRYLEKEIKIYRMSDVHWSLYVVQCLPCNLRPHYIGHLEQWYPETDYVLRKLSANNPTSYWQRPRQFQREAASILYSRKGGESDTMWRDTLKQLPRQLLDNVAKNYKIDFDLFGYNMSIF